MVHRLQRLVILRPENHLAFGGVELQAFQRGDQVIAVVAVSLLQRLDGGDGGGHAAGGEEVWRLVKAGEMLLDQPVIYLVLRNFVVVVGRPFHAGHFLEGNHRRQNVPAGGQFDIEALGPHILQLAQRIVAARPDHENDLALGVGGLQRLEQPLPGGGEVGGVARHIFFENQLGAGVRQGLLESRDAITAEGIVLCDGGDGGIGTAQRHGVGNRVLRGIPPGPEDVAVPLGSGDRIGHGGLDNQHLFILLGHRQHGQRHPRGHRPNRQGHLVVAVGFRQQRPAVFRLQLGVLLDHLNLLAVHFHGPARGVLQAQHQAAMALCGIGFIGPGLTIDMCDLDGFTRQGTPGCQRKAS